MEQELAGLAMSGATTIVTAMATGAWEATRKGVVRLFHRQGQSQAIEAQLDADAAMVERNEDRDPARRALVGSWQFRLAELLRDHPEAEEELRAQIEELAKRLPQGAKTYTQHNHAHGGQPVFYQGDGTVNIHQTPPDQRS
ncbi:hypothetical protein LN042_30165 [Kitasatospora sp. RB6PN24]|uniref:hypothetical protein n=1 Tax=Kitasatospora humi TaxID=2893891 RepID=UPI001E348CAB|nr:hypothetical protein [Kitasatospora humi]MCC9311276.1 hypothetical protein [Kitasatospora humi]